MIKMLIKEGIVFQILSEHIVQHNKDAKLNKKPNSSLSKQELNTVSKISTKILKDYKYLLNKKALKVLFQLKNSQYFFLLNDACKNQ